MPSDALIFPEVDVIKSGSYAISVTYFRNNTSGNSFVNEGAAQSLTIKDEQNIVSFRARQPITIDYLTVAP